MSYTDLGPTIQTGAGTPQSAGADGLTVAARPIADLIAADRYLAAKAALSTQNRGMRFGKILPAGPLSDSQATGIGGVVGFNRFDGGIS